jgi:ATP-binding cassette subfamily B protein/subfamily B ATP-binding cassette protein MsbA
LWGQLIVPDYHDFDHYGHRSRRAADAFPLITKLTMIALGLYFARAGLQFLRSYLAHLAGWGVVADVRKHIYEHLQRLSLRFYEDKQTGQLMSRVINDTDLFEQLISHAVPDVTVNVITLVGVSAVLFSLNWRLTLLIMIRIRRWRLPCGFMPAMRLAFGNARRSLGSECSAQR